jgi:hypothetical protein
MDGCPEFCKVYDKISSSNVLQVFCQEIFGLWAMSVILCKLFLMDGAGFKSFYLAGLSYDGPEGCYLQEIQI